MSVILAASAQKPKKARCNEAILNWRYNLIADYIEPNSSVLDIGSGTGWLARKISQEKNSPVQLIDVVDNNKVDLPFVLYDGKTIPFSDRQFDVSILVFVLHHLQNQKQMLMEAA